MNIAIDEVPGLVFATADNGNIVAANEKLFTALKYSPAELIGKKADLIFTIATRIFQQTHLFPLLKMQGSANEIFISLKARDGNEIPLLVNAERKEVDGLIVNIYAGICVPNRKKFEDELIAARKIAEKALSENTTLVQLKKELESRLQQLDEQMLQARQHHHELAQFNRVVSHDLQEPLRKLILFSNLLLERYQTTDPLPVIDKLTRISKDMRLIISGLQRYVWLTDVEMQPEPLRWDSLFATVKQRLTSDYPGIELNIVHKYLPEIVADPEQMELLFFELMSNSIRFRHFNQQQVTIKISAQQLQLNRYRALEDQFKYVDYIRLQLADEGRGFDPVFKGQIFELFKRLHNESGRGVGLSLCRKIMENHNGEISIDGMENAGSTVSIMLPQQQEIGTKK